MNKVVYIHLLDCSGSIEEILYIDHLLSNAIEVEFWDISSLYPRPTTKEIAINAEIIVTIKSKDAFREKIKSQDKKNTIFINLFTYTWDTLWIDRLLKTNKCQTGWLDRLGLPADPQPSAVRKIYQFLSKPKLDSLLKALAHRLSRFLKKIGYIPEPTVVFAAGLFSINHYKKISKVVEINHFDYENYLLTSDDGKSTVEGTYAVFLDEYNPYHPDFDLLKMKKVEPIAYYHGLNKFFNRVEKLYNTKIVIALHPTSNYKTDVYEGREMQKSNSNKLVRECKFVLAHGSTSLSFAVLHSKPIIFLINDQFEDIYKHTKLRLIQRLAKMLKGSIYNVDRIQDDEEIVLRGVNMQAYEYFKFQYLTSPKSENKLTKHLFLDYLKKH